MYCKKCLHLIGYLCIHSYIHKRTRTHTQSHAQILLSICNVCMFQRRPLEPHPQVSRGRGGGGGGGGGSGRSAPVHYVRAVWTHVSIIIYTKILVVLLANNCIRFGYEESIYML